MGRTTIHEAAIAPGGGVSRAAPSITAWSHVIVILVENIGQYADRPQALPSRTRIRSPLQWLAIAAEKSESTTLLLTFRVSGSGKFLFFGLDSQLSGSCRNCPCELRQVLNSDENRLSRSSAKRIRGPTRWPIDGRWFSNGPGPPDVTIGLRPASTIRLGGWRLGLLSLSSQHAVLAPHAFV